MSGGNFPLDVAYKRLDAQDRLQKREKKGHVTLLPQVCFVCQIKRTQTSHLFIHFILLQKDGISFVEILVWLGVLLGKFVSGF